MNKIVEESGAFKSFCMIWLCGRLTHCLEHFYLQTDEELDPEDVELDEHNTIETRSKCKTQLSNLISSGTNTISSFDSSI
jgi:hypothetical protein